MSLVSVVIPNYNNSVWLIQCLESCLSQKYLKEIIVVDDASTDESWEIIKIEQKKFPAIIKIFKNPGSGANEARNFGFKKSSGEFIQWLDSDDFLEPGKFEKQVEALNRTGSDITYSDFRLDFYDSGVFLKSEEKKVSAYNDFTEEILKDNWLASHSYLMRRSIAEKVDSQKGWNPNTRIAQDREYFTMAALLGAKFVYVPGTFAVYNRWSSSSISGMDFKKRIQLTQALENRFRFAILNSSFSEKRKNLYLNIISTHKIKACYYNPKVNLDYSFSPFAIKWKLIHYKMRIIIPFIYVVKHIQFFLKRSIQTN